MSGTPPQQHEVVTINNSEQEFIVEVEATTSTNKIT